MGELSLFLLVEDNLDDVMLLQRAFIKARVLNPVQLVPTGEAAIDYLRGSGRYANRSEYPMPCIVLLDLKVPGLDGFAVLRWIRSQPDLARLRVIVLTGSDALQDIELAYQLGASSFLVKPSDFEHFVQICRALNGYWLWLDRAPEACSTLLAVP